MGKRNRVLGSVAALAAALLCFRVWLLPDLLVRTLAVTPSGDSRTPADVGLPYVDASFEMDSQRLTAWFVQPPDPEPIAFLLVHGDGESVSDWIPVQKLLYDQGYASLTYDFAGYGNSDGSPSMRMFEAEPQRALQVLLALVVPGTKVSVLGHSFGAAIAVEAFHDYSESRLHSLVFNAGPSALRDILHEVLGVPMPLAMLLPNVIDARSNIGKLEVPVLVIAGGADTVIPASLVRSVYDSATEPKQFLFLPEASHNTLTEADLNWWAPILEWVNGRGALETKWVARAGNGVR